jgi:hypothetical protein
MSLSFANELVLSFNCVSQTRDYKTLLTDMDTLQKVSVQNSKFEFGTHIEYMREMIDKPQFLPRNFDICVGFYTDVAAEFDIFINNEFVHHYTLVPGEELHSLYNKNNERVAWVSLNTPKNETCWEIRNIQTALKPLKLITVGVHLNYDLRRETISSKWREIVI